MTERFIAWLAGSQIVQAARVSTAFTKLGVLAGVESFSCTLLVGTAKVAAAHGEIPPNL